MAVESKIQNPKSKMQQRILIIGHSNIGDAILTLDVIATMHQQHPEAHLTLVVGQRATAVFVDDPRIHALVDTDRFDSALGRLQLAAALWRYRPHLVVDLRHTLYPLLLKPLAAWRYLRRPPKTLRHMRERHLWTLYAQVPSLRKEDERIAQGSSRLRNNPPRLWAGGSGFGAREHFRVGETGSCPQPRTPNPEPTGVFQQPARLKAGGNSLEPGASSLEPPLWFSPKDIAHVEHLWSRWQLDGSRPFVVICPGARSQIKQWTTEGFAHVADRLIDDRAQVLLAGEPAEEPIIEAILGLMTQRHKAHSAIGLTTIRQLGAFMARAHLVIVNDSASLHLASALNAPVITIFGPTDETKYGPTSTRHRVMRRRLFCTPCEQALCAFNHECMRFVSAEEVVRAARELLHGQRDEMPVRQDSCERRVT